MPMVFWIQSKWHIIEIIKTIDLGHRNLETVTTSKVEYVRVASQGVLTTIHFHSLYIMSY